MVLSFLIPSSLHTSSIKWERRLVPRSDSRASGTPKNGTTCSVSSFTIRIVCWSGAGNTKGHFVAKSWKTIMYLLPLSVLGSSMTLTLIWNGLSTGIGDRGGLFCQPTPDTIAHLGQLLQYFTQSLYMCFHHQCRAKALYICLPEK